MSKANEPETIAETQEPVEEYDEIRRQERAYTSPESIGPRRYRPGRGGFDPEQAALVAKARYAFRQRVVFAMLLLAVLTGLLAGFVWPVLWWAHGAIDLMLIGYLTYLRRQVRIEAEVRERRLARLGERPAEEQFETEADFVAAEEKIPAARSSVDAGDNGAVAEEPDSEHPDFDHLAERPRDARYRHAVGE